MKIVKIIAVVLIAVIMALFILKPSVFKSNYTKRHPLDGETISNHVGESLTDSTSKYE